MHNFDLLSTNKFIDKGVYSLSNDKKKEAHLRKQMEFREFMEKKKKSILGSTTKFSNDLFLDDLANSNAIDFVVLPNPISSIKKKQVKTFNRPTSVSIDSRDRDTDIYTNPNNYKIKMNKTFVNVHRIGLKSTEFPNTQQLVRSTPINIANNIIAWQNETDTVTMDGSTSVPSSGYITYKTSVEAGNYDAITLQNEIQLKMNAVTRIVYTANGELGTSTSTKNHTFSVSVNPITDKTEITSVELTNYSNILHTKDGESRIYFAQKFDDNAETLTAHSLSTGDRIYIQDANDIGGIDDIEINGEHVITLDKVDSITGVAFNGTATAQPTTVYFFSTSTKASLSVSFSGGTSVKIGTGISFRLRWDLDNTLGSVLGFKKKMFPDKLYDKLYLADSITPDPSQYFSATTENVIKITSTTNSFTIQIERQNHGLISNDVISIENWPVEQSIGGIFATNIDSIVTNKTYIITRIDDNNFSFSCAIRANLNETKEFNGQIHKEGDVYIPITFYDLNITETFSLIVNNTEIKKRLNIYKILATSDTAVSVFFTSEHDMTDGDRIFIEFDGKYGYTGSTIIRTDEQIKSAAEISNPSGFVVEKKDNSTISIPLLEFPNSWTNIWDVTFGNDIEPESDKTYGQAIIKQLSKGINLNGENYIYMCIQEFPAMTVSSDVSNVFYKLILNSAPGTTLFNTFVGNAFVPPEGPMAKLEYLTISFKTQENQLFQFNNAEHSFTLEIIEVIDVPENSGMSSRRGV